MTTRLDGADTHFLPFNRGQDGHAGNGPDPEGLSPTAYLWRDVLARDTWLDIVGRFIFYATEKKTDAATAKVTKSSRLIFPRFHQLDAVTRLVADARAHGPGQRYLIQHSAGSGKTNSIAWAAHRLATLQDEHNRKVFDTVIVVTDRNVLDAQLQDAIKQIEPAQGVVATISSHEASKLSYSSKSKYLVDALTSGKLIVVVTLQTFPFVLQAMQENAALVGRRFAVIADEAHSSQTGQAAADLKKTLAGEQIDPFDEDGTYDAELVLTAAAKAKAETPNITFLAFTATPKPKTLELFGTMGPDGTPHPWHTYTMAQAIEEGFILDVLGSYTTYQTAYQLALRVGKGDVEVTMTDSDGHKVDAGKASADLTKWVKLHPTNIAQKSKIIVDHFRDHVAGWLDGQAKAMVVCDSRKAALRYSVEVKKYIEQEKLGYGVLVAFSGDVTDEEYGYDKATEASLNGPGQEIRTRFDRGEYQFLIVANKFQTGFDQPKLCAMYVDRKLDGVTAVQTLSRLNRAKPGKRTVIVDFANDASDILAAFQTYYEDAQISETTDPNLLHDLQGKLDAAGLYDDADIDRVVEIALLTTGPKDNGNNRLAGALAPVVTRYNQRLAAAKQSDDREALDELEVFRKDVGTYVRLHDFLSQIINFESTDVEKHAVFMRALSKILPATASASAIDLSDVTLVAMEQKDKGTQQLPLGGGEPVVMGPGFSAAGSGGVHDPKLVLLAELIEALNAKFQGEFDGDMLRTFVEVQVDYLGHDEKLRQQAKVNNRDQFLKSPTLTDATNLAVVENDAAHSKMAQLFLHSPEAQKSFVDAIGKWFYERFHEAA